MKKELTRPDEQVAASAPKPAVPASDEEQDSPEARIKASHHRFARMQRQAAMRQSMFAAIRSLSAESVASLLADPAVNVNEQDEDGMTPLHYAAAYGARPCIRLLVASGKCDYLLRDGQGRYAFELAIEQARDFAVARLLAKKQAQQAAAQGVSAYEPRAS